MRCSSCRAENLEGARFCTQCGKALWRTCSQCGAENPTSANFCGACASPMPVEAAATSSNLAGGSEGSLDRPAAPFAPEGERKLVTALFADIKDSVELMYALDAEEAQAIVDPAIEMMVAAVRNHDGYVVQTLGDGIFALFGAPAAHQDHPLRALRAALEMQSALHAYAERLVRRNKSPIAVRIGANTGEVVVRALDAGGRLEYNSIGHTVNVAARLQRAAPPGSIAISASTAQLVEDYFELRPLPAIEMKGIKAPLAAREVVGFGPLQRHLQISIRRGLSKFVGREAELRRMAQALERVEHGQGQVVALIAEAGIGKSRLLYEFVQTLPTSFRRLETFAVSHGRVMPWAPAIQLLQAYFDFRRDDDAATKRGKIDAALAKLDVPTPDAASYLRGLLGVADGVDPRSQMDPLVRRGRLIEAIKQIILAESRRTPVVVIFEDVHWADEQSRMLLRSLEDGVASARVLILATSRPEGWESRGARNHMEIKFDALTQDGASELLRTLLSGDKQLEPLRRFVLDKTAGSPFFIEEIVHSMFQDGTLARDGGVVLTKPVDLLQLPQTVQGAIAERIDRLAPDHKQVLQELSVIGARIRRDLIVGISKRAEPVLEEILADLSQANFIHAPPGQVPTVFEFRHALTQEVAYNSLLSDRRKRLHERAAAAIEALHADALDEHVNQLAHHYSHTDNLPKAIEYLGRAGEFALQHSAHAEAVTSLNSALRLAATLPRGPERDEKESGLWLALGVSLQASRGYAASEVGEAYERSRELAERCGATALQLSAMRGRAAFHLVRGEFKETFELGERLVSADKDRGRFASDGLMFLGHATLYTGDFAASQDYFSMAATPAPGQNFINTIQYAGDARTQSLAYLALSTFILGFPDRALKYSEEGVAVGETLQIPLNLAQCWGMLSVIYFSRREFAIAQRWIDKTIAYAAKEGFPYWYVYGSILKEWIAAHEHGDEQAIQRFEDNLDKYRQSGAKVGLTLWLSLRSQMMIAHGRHEEALRAAKEAQAAMEETDERLREPEIWRLQGECLLRLGSPEGAIRAEALFRQALAVARRQAAKLWELRAAASLAALMWKQGRAREGVEVLGGVLDWFTEGFEAPDLVEARKLLHEISGAA